MINSKNAILAGLVLSAMAVSSPASAHERLDKENCYVQSTASGYIKICNSNDGGFKFGLTSFGEDRHEHKHSHDKERRYDWAEKKGHSHSQPIIVKYYPVETKSGKSHHKHKDRHEKRYRKVVYYPYH